MKQAFFFLSFLILSLAGISQQYSGETINIKDKIILRGTVVNRISKDTLLADNSDSTVATVRALRSYINRLAFSGVPGPTGATGPAGPTGPTGPAGPPGSGSAIAFAADSNEIRGSNHVYWYGNSLGASSGGTTTTNFTAGVPAAEWLKNISAWDVISFSIPGQTSTQIKNRFLADLAADPRKRYNAYIFEMGENNLGDRATVEADIAACVAALATVGNNRYLVLAIPGQSSSTFWHGAAERIGLDTLNAHLKATHTIHFVDILTGLVEGYNPELAQDVIDHGHQIPPTSLMAPDDVVHYNDNGYKRIGFVIAPYMKVLNPSTDAKALSTQSMHELMSNAPPVNTPLLLTKRLSVNFPTVSSKLYTDGNGASDFLAAEYNGSVAFWNQRAASNKEGGILIRNRYSDEGGSANMELVGTSSHWCSGCGILFHNDQRKIDIGAPVDALSDLTVRGISTFSGAYNIFDNTIYGSGGFSNVFPIPSGIPLNIQSNTNGIRIPLISNATATALHNAGFSSTPVGQIWFNDELRHMQGVTNRPAADNPAFRMVKTLAWLDDLDGTATKISGGAGIGVTGNGSIASPYFVTNTTLPSSLKLTGTLFESDPVANNPYQKEKAIDGVDSTAYVSAAAETNPNSYIGLALATPNVITKIRVRPFTGQVLTGVKVQGSNTSTSTGFVDLFTLPNVPFFQYSQFTIDSIKAYKYVRLYGNNAVYQLAVSELEFYGYVDTSSSYPRLTQSADSLQIYITRFNQSRDTIYPKRTASGTNLLVSNNSWTGVNTFGGANGFPAILNSSATYSYLALDNTTAAPNVGIQYRYNGVPKWSTYANNGVYSFYNNTTASNALTLDTLNNAATFSGVLTIPTTSTGDSSHKAATTAWVKRQLYGGTGGSGTVTNFSAGDLSPLFTTSEATTTTTPALSFNLNNAAAFTLFGRASGSGAPAYIGVDTNFITNFYLKTRGLLSAGTGVSYNNGTGVIGNTGVLSINGSNGAITMDTTLISSFAQKVRSLFAATSPLTYSNGTFGITMANTSTNGYLSSTDWNTFNNKGNVGGQTWTGTHVFPATTTGVTASALDSSSRYATTAYVDRATAKGAIGYKTLGGGTSPLKDVITTGDSATVTYRSLVDNTGTAAPTRGDTGIIVGNVHLNASNAFTGANTFSNSTFQSFTTTTTGAAHALRIYGTGSNASKYMYIGEDAFGNRQIGSSGTDRMNFQAGGTMYFGSNDFINLKNATVLGRVGDATSTATQKNSSDFIFENSIWTGSAEAKRNSGWVAKASTSVNGRVSLVGKVNSSGSDLFSATEAVEYRSDSVQIWNMFKTPVNAGLDSVIAINNGTLKKAPFLGGRTGTPTLGTVAGAGTGATSSLTDGGMLSNDYAGTITVTTGTGSVTSISITLNYATGYAGYIPKIMLSPANAAAAGIEAYAVSANGLFTLGTVGTLATSTIYKFNYLVIP